MKIVLMVPRLFPISGGPEKLIFNLANRYSKLGHNTYVLTYEGAEKEFYTKFKFKVIFLPLIKTKKLKYIMKHLSAPFIVNKLCSIKPDIIHIHDTPFVFPSMIYKKFFHNCPVILTSHYFFDRNSQFLNRFLFGLNLKFIDVVLSVGKQMQDDTKNLYNVNSVLIPLCIDTNKFRKKSKKEILRIKKKYNIPLDKKIILFVGRIAEQKNLELSIRSIAKVFKKDKNILFVIAGTGEKNYVNSLIKLADRLHILDYIKMIGNVPENDISGIYSMANLFLTTSIWEIGPLSAMEALSCSIPVIATDVGNMRDMVFDGYSGSLIKKKTPDEIAKKIQAVLARKGFFSRRIRRFIENNYSIDNISKKYIEFYKTLITKNKIKY